MAQPIALYVNKHCPYSQRVWWALEEAKADYSHFVIDPSQRPPWYSRQVISTGKVPVIAYGGPKTPLDQPSQDSVKIPESSILLEFVADLFPESGLMPKDPVLKARARLFMDAASTKFIPQYLSFLMRDGPVEDVFTGIEMLQDILSSNKSGEWVLGDEISIADLSVAPFLPRMELAFGNDLGAYDVGKGKETYDILRNHPRYARYRQYVDAIKAREEFQKTFDEAHIAKFFTARLNALRQARLAAQNTS